MEEQKEKREGANGQDVSEAGAMNPAKDRWRKRKMQTIKIIEDYFRDKPEGHELSEQEAKELRSAIINEIERSKTPQTKE